MKIEDIARICHEANRIYCLTIGDDSQPFWEVAPSWQKESAVNGVKFHIDNIHAPANCSHNEWMKEKVDNGWKYGPIKDPNKKEHPCIVDFEKLPKEQQAKDYLFKSIVNGLADFID